MSGAVIIPGSSAKSLLLDKVVTRQMPPVKEKLTETEIEQLRRWIDDTLPRMPAAQSVSEQEVLGVFEARCTACHGGLRRDGGLDLRTAVSRLKGGRSGPGFVPGQPEESLLYSRVALGQMPPSRLAKDLGVELPTEAEKAKIRAWIAGGGRGDLNLAVGAGMKINDQDRKHWAFQPPTRPRVPNVRRQAAVRNPIDAFLLDKLEAKSLGYSPEAERLSLMRRVYLDLIGMLPTQAEVEEYQNDRAPDAYERLVDRLLSSSHFGERWAQDWLDLAGYSDSEGFGNDDGVRANAWRYRDYVIRSLNADKPYAQFLTEQIAGDEISDDWKRAKGTSTPETIDRLAATGFLRTVPDPTNSAERGLIAERANVLADEVEVLTSSVMGLTVGCARCHDHKYDPISQVDYYRLSAVLQTAYNPYEWKTPKERYIDLAEGSEFHGVSQHNGPIEKELEEIEREFQKVAEPFRLQMLRERLTELTQDGLGEVLQAFSTQAAKRTTRQLTLTERYRTAIEVTNYDLLEKFPDLQKKAEILLDKEKAAKAKLQPKPSLRVLVDNEAPSVSYLLRRGDAVNFGDAVGPGVPSILEHPLLKPYQPIIPFPGTSGRRLALARWITQPGHPLTGRVFVNRVWMRHFGNGIVATTANFGKMGMAPTHPELLDWLATEFVAGGWRMKAMHRLMVTSQAYRQTSRIDEKLLSADPENQLISRMPLRRMDAEALYDSMIRASGRFDASTFGTPLNIESTANNEIVAKPTKAGFRRSIYVLHKRQRPVSLLEAFDQPVMTPNCTQRRESTVVTQALHMMNGQMSWDLARFMAGRVIDGAPNDRTQQIRSAYLRTYSRPPSNAEVRDALGLIEQFEKQWPAQLESNRTEAPRSASAAWMAVASYCHTLLNSAEFSFID